MRKYPQWKEIWSASSKDIEVIQNTKPWLGNRNKKQTRGPRKPFQVEQFKN